MTSSEEGGWPTWLDRHRYDFAAAILIGFFILYAGLIYVAGQRQLSSLEQAAMGVTGLFISAALSVILGIPFLKRRIRIGSQLRRAYGICNALRNTQENIGNASDRMRGRHFDATTTDEFWQEIAISIQTSIQLALSDAERIVEDWGEMDPEERHRIRDEEDERQRKLQDLYEELQTARSVESDLADSDANESINRAVERLETQIRTLQSSVAPKPDLPAAGTAKAFLNKGEYQKAIAAYDLAIRRFPTTHTNFIGRAKARYLAGDIAGALGDLSIAESMYPADPIINQLRTQIAAKGPLTVPADTSAVHAVSVGNAELARGDGQSARLHYERAQELGWNAAFAKFNLAMAAVLAGDLQRALAYLAAYQPFADTYSALHATALRMICALLSGQDATPLEAELVRQKRQLSPYEFSRSPLRFLEAGLLKSNPGLAATVAPVFAILHEQNVEPSPVTAG